MSVSEEPPQSTRSFALSPSVADGICILCKTDHPAERSLRTATQHGMSTFVAQCRLAGMDELAEYVTLNKERVHVVHQTCRDELKYKAKKMQKLTGRKVLQLAESHDTQLVAFLFRTCFYSSVKTENE